MKIAVSVLNSKNRIEDVLRLNDSRIDYLHIDLMDGSFVSNKQFSIYEIDKLSDVSRKKIDLHMMVENPIEYIEKINLRNIEYITFHYEVKQDINKIIEEIKALGYKVGMAIKPDTLIEEVIPYLDKIDLLLIMSVEPGYGGQEFIVNTYNKLKELTKLRVKGNYTFEIEVDGGINDTNYKNLEELKVDIVVMGTYLTNSDNIEEKLKQLK